MLAKRRIDNWRTLPRAVYNGEHDKEKTYSDGVFFNKDEVKTGTRFIHYGRRDRPTHWVVNGIWTITGRGSDRVKARIYTVRTLSDRLEIRCEETGEFRTMSFEYLVYSALWRVAEKE
jgi:hypothetical protein